MKDGFTKGGYLDLRPDLKLGARSVVLQLTTGSGSVSIPEDASIVGVKPWGTESIRCGLELPSPDNGPLSGNLSVDDLKNGFPLDPDIWTYFNIGPDENRTLYFIGDNGHYVSIVVT